MTLCPGIRHLQSIDVDCDSEVQLQADPSYHEHARDSMVALALGSMCTQVTANAQLAEPLHRMNMPDPGLCTNTL